MKFRKFINLLIVFIFVSGYLAPFLVHDVKAAPIDVNLVLEDVFWGTPPNNVQTVSPGDVNVPLTVIIHNNSSYTLRGVIGTLNLTYPFIDYKTESNQSRAEGQPIQAGDVFNQTGDILPSGSLSLTFYLNIHSDAVRGRYPLKLKVEYNVINNSLIFPGKTKIFTVDVIINNQPPEIYSINPSTGTVSLLVGESANFTVRAGDPDGDPVEIKWLFDNTQIGIGESIVIKANSSDIGSHTLEARVSDGNLTVSNTWTVVINRRIDTNITISTQYLFAGKKNKLLVNVTNNVWHGRVDITISVPQQIVLFNETTLTFYNVTENETISFRIVVFVPESLIGQTGGIGIGVSYKDENGNSYNENYNFGMVIRGVISIKVYGILVDPYPAKPGSQISISGNLLNTGNVMAKYVNISILDLSIITPMFLPYVYVGDLDANSPTPFTVIGYVNSTLAPGYYQVHFLLQYTDELYEEHQLQFTITILVISEENNNQGSEGNQGGQLAPTDVLPIGIGLALVLSIAVIYLRRRGE